MLKNSDEALSVAKLKRFYSDISQNVRFSNNLCCCHAFHYQKDVVFSLDLPSQIYYFLAVTSMANQQVSEILRYNILIFCEH